MLKLASCKAVNGQRKCSVLAMYVVHCSSSYILVLPLIHCTHPPLGQTKVKKKRRKKKTEEKGKKPRKSDKEREENKQK